MVMSKSLSEKGLRETGTVLLPRFDAAGLVTAVVQNVADGEILMLAHVNREALDKTLETGFAHFWSRSRQSLWMKGETSGNRLAIQEIRIDCDQDALVFKVVLEGDAACHTGAKSCFYRKVVKQGAGVLLVPLR